MERYSEGWNCPNMFWSIIQNYSKMAVQSNNKILNHSIKYIFENNTSRYLQVISWRKLTMFWRDCSVSIFALSIAKQFCTWQWCNTEAVKRILILKKMILVQIRPLGHRAASRWICRRLSCMLLSSGDMELPLWKSVKYLLVIIKAASLTQRQSCVGL